MFVTPRGNISNLKYCSYPTIISFHLFIQLFDAKFAAIAPHSLMVFQLQYAKHIKKTLMSIHKHIYTWKLCKLRKKYAICINIIFKKLSVMGEKLAYLYFKPCAKSISLWVRFVSCLRSTSLRNDTTSHVNLPLLDLLQHSIHKLIRSKLFAMYKWITPHYEPIVLK